MARDSHIARVPSQPSLKLYNKRVRSFFNHLEAFSFWRRKIVAAVHFGEPFRFLLCHFCFAFALQQTVAAFDEAVINENGHVRVLFEDYVKGSSCSLKMRSERDVNLFLFKLLRDCLCLLNAFLSEVRVTPSREYCVGVVGCLCMAKYKQVANHQGFTSKHPSRWLCSLTLPLF